jgi:hypothetical protein
MTNLLGDPPSRRHPETSHARLEHRPRQFEPWRGAHPWRRHTADFNARSAVRESASLDQRPAP